MSFGVLSLHHRVFIVLLWAGLIEGELDDGAFGRLIGRLCQQLSPAQIEPMKDRKDKVYFANNSVNIECILKVRPYT